MSVRSFSCFGSDGKLDDNEKLVLGRIISLLQLGEAAELAPRFAQLKALYDTNFL